MILRRATERHREVRSLPVLLAALLITAGGDLSAQDRGQGRSNDSGSRGMAVPRSEGASPRSSSPPPAASPSSPSTPRSSASPSPSGPSRRAVPNTPGEARRQPPSRDRNDPDRRGGGYHGRGHYYPHGYGYYGPRWWWSPYGYWGGWFWLGDNYWPYDPYYHGRYYDRGYSNRGYYDRNETGALDLDVSPGRTQVYLDGQYIGTVDQYDGFPTYLWLEKGTYDVVLYLDGYKTVARQISVYPGNVINVDDRLERGESVRPEDLVSKSTVRRDERIRSERERRERIERGERWDGDGRDRDDRDRDDRDDREGDEWRDRVRRDREDRRDEGERIEIEIPDRDDEQGRLRLEVEPEDASVYIDGRFVGTGEELASLRRGLLVEPGKHRVAVVRPGRRSAEKEFEVEPGEELEIEIELEVGGER